MSRHHGVDRAMRDLIREKPLTRIGKILWEHSKDAHDRVKHFQLFRPFMQNMGGDASSSLFLPLHSSSASTSED